MKKLFAAAILLGSTVAPASAQTLSEGVSSFQPLIGSWACTGQNSPTPETPGFEFHSKFVFEPTLGGQFVKVSYSETPSESLPMSRDNVEFWQTAEDGFTTTFFNAFGQSGKLSSAGLSEGNLVWAGQIGTPNGPMPFEGRIQMSGEDQMQVSPTLIMPDGTEYPVAVISCSKA